MKHLVLAALGFAVLLAGSDSGRAQAQKKEALVDQVKKSIDKGVRYLDRKSVV